MMASFESQLSAEEIKGLVGYIRKLGGARSRRAALRRVAALLLAAVLAHGLLDLRVATRS